MGGRYSGKDVINYGRVIGAQTRESPRLPENEPRHFLYIYSKFGKFLLSFASSEPFAVADGVYKADQDE